MILTHKQIKEITFGATDVVEADGGTRFYRMSAAELGVYHTMKTDDLTMKAYSASGIRLGFVTDSEKLSFEMEVARAGGRRYYSVDVTVNGEYIGSMDNIDPSFKHPISMTEFESEVRECTFDDIIEIDSYSDLKKLDNTYC